MWVIVGENYATDQIVSTTLYILNRPVSIHLQEILSACYRCKTEDTFGLCLVKS